MGGKGSGTPGAVLTDVSIDRVGAVGSRALRGVLGRPQGEGPWPGVVIVHEAFGVDDIMRRQVQRMTDAGYLVLMPDLFSDGGARRCLVATFRALMAGEGAAFGDIESARRHLMASDDCTGRIGVLGFCMGGGFALLTASAGFSASSVNYGRLPDDLDGALVDACPIVGSFGGRDRSLRGAAATLTGGLERAGIAHDVKEYPDAGHSFLNDAPNGPRLLRPISARVMGAGPEPASAADAWRRIEAFFAEHLGER
ncbi:MAG: hypothetical protein RI885_1738 [Actinomycetota bacterium]|jgi:carboxymethylenebutenolidase